MDLGNITFVVLGFPNLPDQQTHYDVHWSSYLTSRNMFYYQASP